MVAEKMIEAVLEGNTAEDVMTQTLSEKSERVHTIWRHIPDDWKAQFEKKKLKRKSGEDEVITMIPDYGEVSAGKGMFKLKTIEPGKASIRKVIRGLTGMQKW